MKIRVISEATILRALETLVEPGAVAELRVLKTRQGTVSGYFDNLHALAAAVVELDGSGDGTYLTLNPVRPDLLARCSNRVKSYVKYTTGDADILRRRWLMIDLDPERPSGISATDDEHRRALDRAREIETWLTYRAWPLPILADSGNGAHLLYRVDLENDAISKTLLEKCLATLAFYFSDAGVLVDLQTANAARLTKVYGTMSSKGDSVPDRPHRRSRMLEVPRDVRPVSFEQLQHLAELDIASKPTPGARGHSPVFDVDSWLASHTNRFHVVATGSWRTGRRWILNPCPWAPDHDNRSAYIIQFANGAIAAGCHHASCSDNGWRELRALVEDDGSAEADVEDSLPHIEITDRRLCEITADALRVLEDMAGEGPRLFQQSAALVRVRLLDGVPRVDPLSLDSLVGELDRRAIWIKETREGDKVTRPPTYVAKDILSLPNYNLPKLRALAEAPFFTRDGRLIATPGYHADVGVLLHNLDALNIPTVSNDPTDTDVQRATHLLLNELLHDFPFVDRASRLHAIGLLLLAFARDLVQGKTPLHGIDAPMAGTGKGLLADLINIIATGRNIDVMPETATDDELRKRITALLLSGSGVALFDNLNRRVASGILAALLTASTWSDRILGSSKIVHLPIRTTWIATGNNLEFSKENARRTVWIRMDAKTEQPHRRTGFRHDPIVPWVREHRGELIWAALTLIQNWVARGRPAFETRTLGSFEEWARTIGGIIQAAGLDGFLENLDVFTHRADTESGEWARFVKAWWGQHSSSAIDVEGLFPIARLFISEAIAAEDERAQRIRLGKALRKRVDWTIAGLKIAAAELRDDRGRERNAWKLQPLRTPVTLMDSGDLGDGSGRQDPDPEVPTSQSVSTSP